MPWTPPESAKTFGFRPLNKGVILSQSSQTLPDGAFVQLDNIIANKEGPRRRPGYNSFVNGATVPYRKVDVMTVLPPSGIAISILLTNKSLYLIDPNVGYTEVDWSYSTGLVNVSGGLVTGVGTAWDINDIKVGDIIRIGAEETEIVNVVGATELVISDGSLTPGTGLSYSIQRTFSPGTSNAPVWVKTIDKIAIADGKHELLGFNLSSLTLGYWISDPGKQPPNGAVIPATVGYFGDRVFQANIVDPVDGTKLSRILWSTLADEADFSFPENYMDLPYSGGPILRVLGLSKYLMVYLTDAIYTGYPTNFPTLPFRMEHRETGGIGLVSAYAVTAFLGGHFFVGQNNFYFTTGDEIQSISDAISNEIAQTMEYPEFSYCCPDPSNFNVVFGVSGPSEVVERIWRWDYRSKSWSRDPVSTQMISNPQINASTPWDDLTGAWDDIGSRFSSWNSIRVRDTQRLLVIESGDALWRGSLSSLQDYGNSPVAVTIVTKDHDFEDPDSLKTWLRFGLKVDSYTAIYATIVFAVSISTNRGISYKSVGNITIPVGKDEGYVNFRATGSTLRVKLTSSSFAPSYYISEYTIRAIGFGEELDVSTH